MLWMPAVNDEVVSDATPELKAAVPRVADPFLKVTISPFGGVPEDELTVALKVIAWPTVDGFSEDVSAVVVKAMMV
jgi:hypothetical protein